MKLPRFRVPTLYALAAFLLFNACTSQIVFVGTQNQQYSINADHSANREMDLFVSPYRDSLEKMVDKVLATSEIAFTVGRPAKDLYPPQVAMGNFMSDAILTIAKQKAWELNKPIPEFSFYTWGGIRKSLPKGDITLRNVFELMPFENEMMILTLNGKQLKSLLSQLSKNYNPISGATMNHEEESSIRLNGKLIDDEHSYHVVASDYYASGGDNLTILQSTSDSYFSGIKIRDAIVLYLEQLTRDHQTLTPDYEPRIKN